MAHHVYTTDAFVIEGVPSSEANKSYLIFTKDLGMLRATAQGVRLLKSKLRYSLQDFSEVTVSVVRGKDIWRITSAWGISNLYEVHKDKKDTVKVLAQIFVLIKRLVPGEEKNEKLFNIIQTAFAFLTTEDYGKEEMINFECILVLNILFELGYVGTVPKLDEFIGVNWDNTLVSKMGLVRKIALQEINKSLKETQL